MRLFALGFIWFSVSAIPISAQSILKNNKIPKDLVITLSLGGTIQFSTHYTYKITSDGKVFYDEEQSGLPVLIITGKIINAPENKKPRLKDKFSKEQLRQMIFEFENSGFFQMAEHYEGDKTLKEVLCVNHASEKGLSITANGKTKKVYFYLGCSYGENSPLKSFLSLYDKISKELNGVKKIVLKNRKR